VRDSLTSRAFTDTYPMETSYNRTLDREERVFFLLEVSPLDEEQ
jgi:hypothetical protein